MDRLNHRLDRAKGWTSEMEDRAEEFTQKVTHSGSVRAITLDWHNQSMHCEGGGLLAES